MIEFCVLGRLDLRGSEGEAVLPILAQPKRAALLAYLAVATPRGFHRRDKLLGLFWPERDSEHARGALRNALYYLRQSLGEGVVVNRGAEEVGLAADAILCDAVAFEAALDEGRTKEALDLYRGNLLEGFFISEAPEFERWLDLERERLRGRAAEAAWTLVEREEARGNGVEAAKWARRAASFTPNDEAAFRRLLELLDRLGDRTGAIEEYEAFARRSRQHHEAEPSPDTQALIALIREREAAVAGEYLARPVEGQLAEVCGDDVLEEHAEAAAEENRRLHFLTWRTAGFAFAGALAVWGLVAALWVAVTSLRPGVRLNPNHVVVAVFRNATGDPSLDHVGERTGHWITQGLQQAAIPMTPWHDALQSSEYVESESEAGRVRDPVRALAEKTGAGLVISGAVYLVGRDSLEIQMNVTDVAQGRSLPTVPPLRSARANQTELIGKAQQRAVAAAAVSLGQTSQRAYTAPPPTFEAYQEFRQAGNLHGLAKYDDAIPYYRRALEFDSTWAEALLRMSKALFNLDSLAQFDSVMAVLEGLSESLTPYERASMQALRADRHGDLEAQVAAYGRAAELAPGSLAVFYLGVRLVYVNRPRESLDVYRTLDTGRGWNPSRHHWNMLTNALLILGEYEEALEASRRAHRLRPDGPTWVLGLRSRPLAALGRAEELDRVLHQLEATATADNWLPADGRWVFVTVLEALRANGHLEVAHGCVERVIGWFEARPGDEAANVRHRHYYGRALLAAGRLDEAQEVFDGIVEEQPGGVRNRHIRAFIAAARGDTLQALDDLAWYEAREEDRSWEIGIIAGALGHYERALQLIRDGTPSDPGRVYLWWSRNSVLYEPLRDYPPFQDFIRPKG